MTVTDDHALRRPRRPDRALAVAGAAPGGVRRARAGLDLRRRAGRGRWPRGVRRRAGRRVARAVADDAAQARGRAAADLARPRGPRSSGVANTLLLDADGGRHGLQHRRPRRRGGAWASATDATLHGAVVLGGGATATSVLLALAERGLRRGHAAGARPGAGRPTTVAAVARHRHAPEVDRDRAGRPRAVRGRRGGLDDPRGGPDRRRARGRGRRPGGLRRALRPVADARWPSARPRPGGRSSAGSTCCCGRRSTRCGR